MYQSFTEDWADGTYSFRLDQGGWIELDRKLDAGPIEIFQRLKNSTWRVNWIVEIIRCGLIGGGMKPAEAIPLIRRYVEKEPPLDNIELAMRIVEAGLYSPPAKEGEAGELQAGPTPENGELTPPNSTEVLPPLA
jgi:hypothetical protein